MLVHPWLWAWIKCAAVKVHIVRSTNFSQNTCRVELRKLKICDPDGFSNRASQPLSTARQYKK